MSYTTFFNFHISQVRCLTLRYFLEVSIDYEWFLGLTLCKPLHFRFRNLGGHQTKILVLLLLWNQKAIGEKRIASLRLGRPPSDVLIRRSLRAESKLLVVVLLRLRELVQIWTLMMRGSFPWKILDIWRRKSLRDWWQKDVRDTTPRP